MLYSIIITILIFGFTGAILIVKYVNGDFTIKSNEIIKQDTYENRYRNNLTGYMCNDGKLTRVVHKITYESGRVKYETEEYNH